MASIVPNSQITHKVVTLLEEVRKADKDFDVQSRKSPEYDFLPGRMFERVDKNFRQYADAEGGTP